MIEWKIRDNFPFGHKFKFDTEFELKFLEEKLLLNLGQIYWEFKLVSKNLTNSLKFLFSMAFHIMNLYWHGCMSKSEVSIQALLDLV
jgi:hypothetical protein